MTLHDYDIGYEAGVRSERQHMRANYDAWKRACEARGIQGQLMAIADLAVRQVIYGNELGTPPDETEPQETP